MRHAIPRISSCKAATAWGADWPISYEDLEPYYCDAEDEMLVSGDNSSEVNLSAVASLSAAADTAIRIFGAGHSRRLKSRHTNLRDADRRRARV